VRIAASSVVIATITAVYFLFVPVKPTTVAFSYLVAILFIATGWGIAEATIASILAFACFNFFFLPPVGTWTIADPQDWVALFAFLVTAIVASQLSGRARQRAIDTLARQTDLERLYALSRALLLSGREWAIPDVLARQIADTFHQEGVALYDHRTGTIARGGPIDLPGVDDRLRDVVRQSVPSQEASGVVVTTIRLGGEPIGSMALAGKPLSDTVLQSIANLAAIALERAREQEAAARADAARRSGELRAAVLDAVAHEFKTPLTSIKAAASELLATVPAIAREHELVEIVDEESTRLQTLVSDAVQMLRIEAGDFTVRRERHNLAQLVSGLLVQMSARLDGYVATNSVPDDIMIDADAGLLRLALRQLLDNAAKYAPPRAHIDVMATCNGTIGITVRNSGSVIPEREQAQIFDRFYRGLQGGLVPGTGMGLAIVRQVAEAHGGSVRVTSSQESGTAFTLSIPRGEPGL
jgi:two-component system, OmpR family, sensor histidine kinase KdpD